ncbi:MAG: hypothetical protein ACR2PG_04995 [Hyphomicrobiaceae bacterium]
MRTVSSCLVGGLVAIAGFATTYASTIACDFPKPWSRLKPVTHPTLPGALLTKPTKITVGEPFSINVRICAPPTTGNFDRWTIEATMPAHRHGMNYRPVVQRRDSEEIEATGLVFHMPGHWQIDLAAYRGDEPMRWALDVHVK